MSCETCRSAPFLFPIPDKTTADVPARVEAAWVGHDPAWVFFLTEDDAKAAMLSNIFFHTLRLDFFFAWGYQGIITCYDFSIGFYLCTLGSIQTRTWVEQKKEEGMCIHIHRLPSDKLHKILFFKRKWNPPGLENLKTTYVCKLSTAVWSVVHGQLRVRALTKNFILPIYCDSNVIPPASCFVFNPFLFGKRKNRNIFFVWANCATETSKTHASK